MSEKPLQLLGDEQIDGVAGGYLFCEGRGTGKVQWLVLDNKGDEVARFDSYYRACDYADRNGYTNNEINS